MVDDQQHLLALSDLYLHHVVLGASIIYVDDYWGLYRGDEIHKPGHTNIYLNRAGKEGGGPNP